MRLGEQDNYCFKELFETSSDRVINRRTVDHGAKRIGWYFSYRPVSIRVACSTAVPLIDTEERGANGLRMSEAENDDAVRYVSSLNYSRHAIDSGPSSRTGRSLNLV